MKKTKTKILAAMLVAASVIQFPISNVYASEVQETQDVIEGAKYLEEICSSEEDKIPNTTITDEQLSLMNDYSSVVNYYTDTTEYELGYKENISGIYCGEDEGIVVLTTDNDLTTVENEVDSLVSTDAVKIEHAEFSYNELLALQSAIQEQVNMSQNEDDLWAKIADVSVDDKSNKVIVAVKDLSENDKVILLQNIENPNMISFVESENELTATDLKPGARIMSPTVDSQGNAAIRCYSIGCRAWRVNSDGTYQYGFITAGHDNKNGDKFYYGSTAESNYIGKVVVCSKMGYWDFAFVALENRAKYRLSNSISYSQYTLSSGKYLSSVMEGQICAFAGAYSGQLLFGRVVTDETAYMAFASAYDSSKKIVVGRLVSAKMGYDVKNGDSGGLLFAVIDGSPCVIGTLTGGTAGTKMSYYSKYALIKNDFEINIY